MAHNEPHVHPVEFEATAKGRVVIPSQMRNAVGWDGPMVMYVEDGRVVIEPRAQLAERTRREVAQTWQGEEESAVDELIAERRAEAQREAAG